MKYKSAEFISNLFVAVPVLVGLIFVWYGSSIFDYYDFRNISFLFGLGFCITSFISISFFILNLSLRKREKVFDKALIINFLFVVISFVLSLMIASSIFNPLHGG